LIVSKTKPVSTRLFIVTVVWYFRYALKTKKNFPLFGESSHWLLQSGFSGTSSQQATIDGQPSTAGEQQAIREKQVKSLAGIKALVVMIGSDTGFQPVQPYLTEAQLRTDVELRVRKAGIPVVRVEDPDHAILYVDVAAQRTATGRSLCVFDLSVRILQTATVDRNNQKAPAATWGPKGYLGLDSQINGAAETIRHQVSDFVDEFLNDYLTANPIKREAERQP
jgi:hypothetical protein